jgi:hypothetical protein
MAMLNQRLTKMTLSSGKRTRLAISARGGEQEKEMRTKTSRRHIPGRRDAQRHQHAGGGNRQAERFGLLGSRL